MHLGHYNLLIPFWKATAVVKSYWKPISNLK
jgi:hypothetical protein